MPRCPKGTQRNKTTGDCEPKETAVKQTRCPKGTKVPFTFNKKNQQLFIDFFYFLFFIFYFFIFTDFFIYKIYKIYTYLV